MTQKFKYSSKKYANIDEYFQQKNDVTMINNILIETPSWISLLTSFVIGCIFGSFISMLTYRLPLMMQGQRHLNLFFPASHCPQCSKRLKRRDLVPLMGYVMQSGHCRHCQQAISLRYPITEILSGLICFFSLLFLQNIVSASLISLFLLTLLCLSLIDLSEMILPDFMTLPLLWIGLLVNLNGRFVSLPDALIGAVLGYLLLFFTSHAYRLWRGEHGMGYGDFKLFAAIGAWLGYQALASVLLVAAVGVLVSYTNQQLRTKIPFGPYLSLGAFIYIVVYSFEWSPK
jgi:prepilin signal peptidase PulO-like enzyme (type II secretory pathway)